MLCYRLYNLHIWFKIHFHSDKNVSLLHDKNVSLLQQQPQPSVANLDGWHDVGPLLSEPRCNVTHFYVAPPQCDDVNQKWQWDTGPDFSKYLKVKLKPNTAYRFRVAAIDSNGQGPWSEVRILCNDICNIQNFLFCLNIYQNFSKEIIYDIIQPKNNFYLL